MERCESNPYWPCKRRPLSETNKQTDSNQKSTIKSQNQTHQSHITKFTVTRNQQKRYYHLSIASYRTAHCTVLSVLDFLSRLRHNRARRSPPAYHHCTAKTSCALGSRFTLLIDNRRPPHSNMTEQHGAVPHIAFLGISSPAFTIQVHYCGLSAYCIARKCKS